MDKQQFLDYIVAPVLKTLDLDSLEARELLLGTALQESGLRYVHQLNDGPALGVFQMEPATHDDIWHNFLSFRPELAQKVVLASYIPMPPLAVYMTGNLWYAAAMCRIHYARIAERLPPAGELALQADYWKRYYNTPQGAGTTDEYMRHWR